eukprot:tig00021127_g18721.t1
MHAFVAGLPAQPRGARAVQHELLRGQACPAAPEAARARIGRRSRFFTGVQSRAERRPRFDARPPHASSSCPVVARVALDSVPKVPVVANQAIESILKELEGSQRPTDCEALVIGTGPAGLALASELSARGVSVVLAGDNVSARWIPNYGVWLDEFLPLGYSESLLAKIWPRTTVDFRPEARRMVLDRPYGRVDRVKMQEELLRRCQRGGVRLVQQTVTGVEHDRTDSSLVRLGDGGELRAGVVVDATGHGGRFMRFGRDQDALGTEHGGSLKSNARAQGVQVAYGVEAETEGPHVWPLDEMLLMDFRSEHLTREEAEKEAPTFLYAMPMSETRVFLEETSLVARPALEFGMIKDRMERRLASLGVTLKHVEEVEYCYIPMGGDLPEPGRVVGFGGAARLVHPSTGYMFTRGLAMAPVLAEALAAALRGGDRASAERVAAAGWGALWSGAGRKEREFFKFGMEVLLDLDLAETRLFFDRFFALPDWQWHGFLKQDLRTYQILAFGLTLFAGAPWSLRLRLVLAGLRDGGLPLLAALLG